MKMLRLLSVASAAFFIASSAPAQNVGTVTNHAFAIGKGPGVQGYTSLLCGTGQIAIKQASGDPACFALSGDASNDASGVVTLATVNSNTGSFGSATNCPSFTANGKGLITAASQTTCTPAVGSITGLATGVATWLATPSSANLRAALTDEVGTGAAYFVGGALGTPASATLTNATGLPLSGLTAQGAFTFVGNNTGGSASPTAVDIAALTSKASPAGTDLVMISDQAASGAWKKVQISSLASAGSVASIDTKTGAFTTGNGIDSTAGNVIELTAARRTLPTKQVFTSGSGTYTTPANTLWIEITIVGGGGGGAGGNGSAATSGGNTCLNTTGAACTSPVYQAGGGTGGSNANPSGPIAGGAISGSGTCDWSVAGGQGSPSFFPISGSTGSVGGRGGDSSLGGAGAPSFANMTAGSAATNSGSGGGGGGVVATTAGQGGAGGGAGATCHVVINSPAASYTFAVGTGGSGSAAGTGGGAGGSGAAGQIIVYEHYGS